MDEAALHSLLTWAQLILAFATFAVLSLVRAPYGRHYQGGWGKSVPSTVAWVLMECPAVLVYCGVFMLGEHRLELAPLVLLGLWQVHYVHRTFIFPFLLRSKKAMPLAVVGSGFAFNSLNAYINARWISHFGHYTVEWLTDPRFIAGVGVFVAGYVINKKADRILLNLRKPGDSGYKIPRGWLYEYISCPNYLGEILEWTGWAIATWSLPGLAFALYTAANVGPRAMSNHRWYQEKFSDYPRQRKAIIPFVL